MKTTLGWTALWMGLIALLFSSLSAQERWVYRYHGPGGYDDQAYSLVAGTDGNLYAAGYISGSGTAHDLAVISLTALGEERWVYSYDGPGNSHDNARAITTGPEGIIYAAGTSAQGYGSDYDLVVASLDTLGTERWLYRYNGVPGGNDFAYSIAMGPDSTVYAAGHSVGYGTDFDLIVVNLTRSGDEQWVYRYNGPGNEEDRARAIVAGPDGNVYVAGTAEGSVTESDFTVISLTSLGGERWIYCYDGPVNLYDHAEAVAIGTDGNLYVAGTSYAGQQHSFDFMVISLTPSGGERWIYRYNGSGNGMDVAFVIVAGTDGNIYAAGYSSESGTPYCFTVISLTPSGQERWIYTQDGSGHSWDCANSLVMGGDGNVYATGVIDDSVTVNDIIVVSLTPSGEERWVYRYDGPDNDYDWDVGYSIAAGIGGNLYAAGYSCGVGTYEDFTVIGLSPDVGVEERPEARGKRQEARLFRNSPNPFSHITGIRYQLVPSGIEGIPDVISPVRTTLRVYDVAGRLVKTLLDEHRQPGYYSVSWDGKNETGRGVSSGIYFCRLRTGMFTATKTMMVLR